MSSQQPVLKVALLLHDLEEGGMQTVCLKLVQAFSSHPNIEIELVLSNGIGVLFNRVPDTVKTVDLKLPFQLCLKYLYKITIALSRYLRQSQPDVILSNLPFLNIVTPLAKILAFKQVSIILVEHTLPLGRSIQQESHTFLSPRFTSVIGTLSRIFYSQADHIVVPSQGMAQEILQSTGMHDHQLDKLRVILNPAVDRQLYQKAQAGLSHPWFQLGQPPVILAVGRLTPQKDYETLLRSFAVLRQRVAVRLVILGDGPARRDLEALLMNLGIDADVLLPGFVDNPYAYMSRASVFVLSSVWETFGLVLAEALACGCPVVSTNCDYGPAEVLEHGKYGTLVPVKDVDAIAQALETVLTQTEHDPTLLKQRAEAFSLDQAVQQYLRLLGLVDADVINNRLQSSETLYVP